MNAIAPDGVDTALLSPKLAERVRRLNLLEKLIRPEEVAEGILFLARPDTLTGQTLNFNAPGGTCFSPPCSPHRDEGLTGV